jgi:adenine-specific DNA methylase
VLLGLLLPDPADPACPAEFKEKARALLYSKLEEPKGSDKDLRERLLEFVGELSAWESGETGIRLETARNLVKLAWTEEPPAVVDPFAGGGSIPLEALRLGCETFATDLNPVAVLALATLLETIPRGGPALAKALRQAGVDTQVEFEKLIGEFYPTGETRSSPIAYLWARTIRCEAPNCGCEIPLARSFWLAKKGKVRFALRYLVTPSPGGLPSLEFEVFSPKKDEEVPNGTVTRAKAECPSCRTIVPAPRVAAQLATQGGGANVLFDSNGDRVGGATLLAVVTQLAAAKGRQFRAGNQNDYFGVWKASKALGELTTHHTGPLSLVPDEALPPIGTLGFRVQRYGITEWGQLFSARQLVALVTLQRILSAQAKQNADLSGLLALAFNRVAMSGMSLTRWNPVGEKMQHTFGRQALPIVWDFAEVVPCADAPGGWTSGYELAANVIEAWPGGGISGQVQQADARESPLPDSSCLVWFTDPPYYDAVPYADLSDFFYVWLKRFPEVASQLSRTFKPEGHLTPKIREAVQDLTKTVDGKPKDAVFFEESMAEAFAEGRRILRPDGIGCVVFAHKTTEGWEALLTGLIRAGWVITASWPIATEMGSRLRARESAALATSIHLVCRPRSTNAGVGEWAEVARALPGRVRSWIDRLTEEGIRGADLVFACIGPAMESFSSYSKVVDSQDREVPLGGDPEATDPHRQGYLAKVWEVVGRIALERVLEVGKGGSIALEEDARLTALFLWAVQGATSDGANGMGLAEPESDDEDVDEPAEPRRAPGHALPFDVVRRFAQPLGIHLDVWEGRIIRTEKGVVHLVPVAERASQLFGVDELHQLGDEHEVVSGRGGHQLTLPMEEPSPRPLIAKKLRKGEVHHTRTSSEPTPGEPKRMTTLDRLHMAMILQASGASTSLRALLQEERKHGPEFERLAHSLTALYPRDSEERRLVEALALLIPK